MAGLGRICVVLCLCACTFNIMNAKDAMWPRRLKGRCRSAAKMPMCFANFLWNIAFYFLLHMYNYFLS